MAFVFPYYFHIKNWSVLKGLAKIEVAFIGKDLNTTGLLGNKFNIQIFQWPSVYTNGKYSAFDSKYIINDNSIL